MILGAILELQNRPNRSWNLLKIRAPIWSDIFGHSGASGGRSRLDFEPIWGAISGSRLRDAKLANIVPRHSESTIFGVPGGSGIRFWSWRWWQTVFRRNRHYSHRGRLWQVAKERLEELKANDEL